jgi:hypothetical protein
MTLTITINIILSAIVFTTVLGFLAAAIKPARQVIATTPGRTQTPCANRPPAAAAAFAHGIA